LGSEELKMVKPSFASETLASASSLTSCRTYSISSSGRMQRRCAPKRG
jgi:hypothetical protein